MRGRKPTPTRILQLTGNPSHRPLKENEPQSPAILPECPAHLDADAQAAWQLFGNQLLEMGVMQEIDGTALAGLCIQYARWAKAEKFLNQSGEILKNAETGKMYKNPYLGVADRALKSLQGLLVEFGMTPSSRVRLSIMPPNKERSELDAFLERQPNAG